MNNFSKSQVFREETKLSVKSDYAARAVIGLAKHYPTGAALKVEDLAAESSTPANYLVQILIELKSRHIVKSVRGHVHNAARPRAKSRRVAVRAGSRLPCRGRFSRCVVT